MNLHLLPADNQLFVPSFVETVVNGVEAHNNLLMCFVREMDVSHRILPFASPELVRLSIKYDNVNRVIFHSLQPQAFPLFRVIQETAPECRIDWVYWGETYDDPSTLMGTETLNEFLKAHGVPNWISTLMTKGKLTQSLLRARAAILRCKISKYTRYIDTMFHWSRLDYEHVKTSLNCHGLRYQKFIYDVIDFPIANTSLMEQDLKCNPAECIVLGHSATMRNNHLDVLPAVCEFAMRRKKVLVCPLSYGLGGKHYVESIKHYVSHISGLSYRLCYNFYPLSDYLTFLSRCGAYIAPGRRSIGAGNMLSYTLSGGIPTTDHRNSTGTFLKSLGAEVAIYRNESDIVSMLDRVFGSRSQKNRMIIDEAFSLKNKSKYYGDILAIV